MRVRTVAVATSAFALLLLGGTAAQAATDTTKHESGLMDFGPNGFGGWSCPEGTEVVTGGYTYAEGAEHLDVKVDAKMEAATEYPHYTTKADETGWYVQNGEQAQKLNVWVECKAKVEESPSPEPEPSETVSPSPDVTASPSTSPSTAPTSPVPGQAGSDDDQPGLPVTGAKGKVILASGAGLLLAGVALMFIARRRRFTA